MKPTVINIKDAPTGWQNDPRYLYIGRQSPRYGGLKRSTYANPYSVQQCGRERAIALYRQDATTRIMRESHVDKGELRTAFLDNLTGKILVCWCKPEACHGDVLVELWELHVGTTPKPSV